MRAVRPTGGRSQEYIVIGWSAEKCFILKKITINHMGTNYRHILFTLCILLQSCIENAIISYDADESLSSSALLDRSGRETIGALLLDVGCSPVSIEFDNNGNPVGGGAGYTSIITPAQATDIVTNLTELKVALNNAQPGDIVFIPDTVIIEITNPDDHYLPLNAGVTLASSRGNDGCGALITTDIYGLIAQCETCEFSNWISELDEKKGRHLFRVQGDNVRVTGIRFIGPSTEIGNLNQMKGKSCVLSNGHNNLLIDNNEFQGWPYEAISITQNSANGILIRNNYIHHNMQIGFGYGIGIKGTNAYAVCKGNYLSHNRHDIANEGRPHSGYEAAYNFIGTGGTSHNFDVHGGCEYGAQGTEAEIAGSFFHIHHNVFNDNGNANIAVRGVPQVMCLIEKNRFFKSPEDNIIRQMQESGDCQAAFNENLFVCNNVYDYGALGSYKGYFLDRAWQGKPSHCYLPGTFEYSSMGFAVGDFNGNAITDFIIEKDNAWTTIEYPSEEKFLNQFSIASYQWTTINTAQYELDEVVFDDFTGDGTTDAFLMDGIHWYLSDGAQGSWVQVNTSGYTRENVAIGDFDGDSKADLFKGNGSQWSISKGGKTGWIDINASEYLVEDLAFGFFNSNNKYDVFKTNLITWSFSDGGATIWTDINVSQTLPGDMIFADIDRDGITDIVVEYDYYHKVSWGGQSGWVDLNYNNEPNLLNEW